MKPDMVADIGNSRIKWGRCSRGAVAESVSLPADDPAAWQTQIERWALRPQMLWAAAGVHPQRRDALIAWLRQRGDQAQPLTSWRELPLSVNVEQAEQVGLDRLLNAVAARNRLPGKTPAIIIDAGSAVTVDYLDENGSFQGGAIFPGLRLMAQALHDHTALLPLVDTRCSSPPMPGKSTTTAIKAGVFWSVAGGIRALVNELTVRELPPPIIFLTGGDASLLGSAMDRMVSLWPTMTLEGIRISAESLP